jgi:TolB-like protein
LGPFNQLESQQMRNFLCLGFCRKTALLLLMVFGSTAALQNIVVASPLPGSSPGVATPRAQYSLAVLPLSPSGRISADEAAKLTRELYVGLKNTGIFTMTDQSTVEAAMVSVGLMESGCSTVECGVEAGKLLSTQLVANGSVRQVGQMFFVEVQMIHVASGQVVQKVSEDFDGNMNGLMQVMGTSVVRKLVGTSASSGSTKAVSSTESAQELSPVEYGSVSPESESTEPDEETEVKRGGSGKFLILGLVAAGAIGAGIYLAQSTDKDGNNDGNTPNNPSTDLPTPPRFP